MSNKIQQQEVKLINIVKRGLCESRQEYGAANSIDIYCDSFDNCSDGCMLERHTDKIKTMEELKHFLDTHKIKFVL